MTSPDWKLLFDQELNQSASARNSGNEGKARVCARRAAGIIIGEYLTARGYPDQGPSCYERLKYLQTLPNISPEVKDVSSHFLIRVLPDHSLPIEADLIEDARRLANLLIPKFERDIKKEYSIIPDLIHLIDDIPSDSIVSRTIHNDENIKSILFGFAPGQELSEHTASMPAIIHILQGEAKISLGNESIHGAPGTWVHMPANQAHSVFAESATIMMLTLIKNK